MPESLCTYFWALVLAYILIIPLEITGSIGSLMRLVIPGVNDTPSNPAFKTLLSFFAVFFAILLYFLLIPVLQFFYEYKTKDIIAASIVDVILLVYFTILFFASTDKKFLVVEYTKAKIKGICPRITWK
jgi:hypothetical protein